MHRVKFPFWKFVYFSLLNLAGTCTSIHPHLPSHLVLPSRFFYLFFFSVCSVTRLRLVVVVSEYSRDMTGFPTRIQQRRAAPPAPDQSLFKQNNFSEQLSLPPFMGQHLSKPLFTALLNFSFSFAPKFAREVQWLLSLTKAVLL